MIKFSREWAMPHSDTFSVKPIGDFVKRYLSESYYSVDPFARNKDWAAYTNDLNPNTSSQYHLDAVDFLKEMALQNVRCDLMILDPPYSPRQITECYSSIGRKATTTDTQSSFWKNVRNAADVIMSKNSIALSFGWNSVGMGKKRGYELIELMTVCHGGAHNDTICIAEIKL